MGALKTLGFGVFCLTFGRTFLSEFEMKFTIRVEITTDWDETEIFEISEIERRYCELDQSKIGLSLAEGKDVLHDLQQIFVAAQVEEV